MAKYHISPKTNRPNICRAHKQSCPVSDDSQHFASKEDALAFIEQKAKEENYTFTTHSKKQVSGNTDLTESEREEFVNHVLSESRAFSTSELMEELAKTLPGFTALEVAERPDYVSEAIVEYKGEHYSIRSHEDYWTYTTEITGINRVYPKTKTQMGTVATEVKTTRNYPEINDLMRELQGLNEPFKSETRKGRPFNLFYEADGDTRLNFYGGRGTFTREDGSKVRAYYVESLGEKNFLDEPPTIQNPVPMEENGERQNGRKMDVGYMVFDERSGTGVLFKWRSGSEGGDQSSNYQFKRGYVARQVTERDKRSGLEPGEMHVLKADGTTHEETYYETK